MSFVSVGDRLTVLVLAAAQTKVVTASSFTAKVRQNLLQKGRELLELYLGTASIPVLRVLHPDLPRPAGLTLKEAVKPQPGLGTDGVLFFSATVQMPSQLTIVQQTLIFFYPKKQYQFLS